MDKEGKPKPFGFVCFKHADSVPYAMALLNEIRLYGRPIKLQYRFGSSHLIEMNSPYQGTDNTNRDPSTNSNEWWPSHAFPPPSGSMEAAFCCPPPFFFQGMMNNVAPHYGPVTEEPYLQMIPQHIGNWHLANYASDVQEFLAAPSPMQCLPQNQGDEEFKPNTHRSCKRKRQLTVGEHDNDSNMGKKRRCNRKERQKYKARKH
ncbi:splicing regulator RBM11 isoform X2 [Ambystoma mexicanum]